MATAKNILIIFLLGYFCRAEKTVFLSDKLASGVLVRQKRYNSGAFEEFAGGNLERECLEEKCTYEEAREVFENDDKTSEFWKQYVDGDQCISNPCLNEGVCKDDVSSYVCWCAHGYRGKNCEFELPVTCTINNGGCQQMCREDAEKKVTCSCASGYKLGADGQTCEEMVQYPCGRVSAPEAVPKEETRTILDLEDNANNSSSTEHHNSTENIHLDDHSDDIVPVTVDPNVRIVGGTDSLKGEFPWQVYNFFKKGVKRVKMVYKMQPDNNNHSVHLNPTVHLALPTSQCAAVQECLCCSFIDKGATLSQEVCYWPDHQV